LYLVFIFKSLVERQREQTADSENYQKEVQLNVSQWLVLFSIELMNIRDKKCFILAISCSNSFYVSSGLYSHRLLSQALSYSLFPTAAKSNTNFPM
jgi:hypothetical protein